VGKENLSVYGMIAPEKGKRKKEEEKKLLALYEFQVCNGDKRIEAEGRE